MASYFRDDKEVNTYYPWDLMEGDDYQISKKIEYEIEMYNDTVVWVVPFDRTAETEFEMSFSVYTLEEYLYGNKYNLISINISVVGGTVLILGVVFYLDGFLTLYKII